ncbi:MAG TPA: DUF2071 domain-containing protein [Actinoallomurus sp.]|jgi:uncharacterized protein YqjF (DUF2071 family)
MRSPRLSSVIERRLLVSYRVEPEIAARLLPPPLRPQRVEGWAVAGICLIRLGRIRPAWLPGVPGLRSENAAHRIAVEWDGPQGPRTGVYIPRRDSGSLIAVAAGGRLFPGRQTRASFQVRESADEFGISVVSQDDATRMSVEASVAERLTGSMLFADVDKASEFFRCGSVGFSPSRDGTHLDGVELRTGAWRVEPLEIRGLTSSFFDDRTRFPKGTATADCALLMRDVPATWHPVPPLRAGGPALTRAR